MHISYLVDGYNLLFTLGMLDHRDGRHSLEQARTRLLDYLHEAFGEGDHDVTVVFDSGRGGSLRPPKTDHHGFHVQYSAGREADDVIEAIIAECTTPGNLVVISNDHRLRDAARRKGARPWSTTDFLDHRDARSAKPRVAPPSEVERPLPSREEVQRWLAEFGDIADDPEFRELFEPFPFKDGEADC